MGTFSPGTVMVTPGLLANIRAAAKELKVSPDAVSFAEASPRRTETLPER